MALRFFHMEDLKAKLEKYLTDAEDCDLIARLATDPNKRLTFKRLAIQLRAMADEIRRTMASMPKPARSTRENSPDQDNP